MHKVDLHQSAVVAAGRLTDAITYLCVPNYQAPHATHILSNNALIAICGDDLGGTGSEAHLHKDARRVGPSHTVQAVKDKPKVGARQQLLEAIKVKDLLEEAQVIFHRVNDLQKTTLNKRQLSAGRQGLLLPRLQMAGTRMEEAGRSPWF